MSVGEEVARPLRGFRVSRMLASSAALTVLVLAIFGLVARHRDPSRVAVPAGDFEMGAADGDHDERPVHRQHVERFEIDRREVTLSDYARCVAQGRCTQAGTFHAACVVKSSISTEQPINCVTYQQATAFCAFRGGRLPTEAEWEYAARGSDQRVYPWGSAPPGKDVCWPRKQVCRAGTSHGDRSAFGVRDMGGNVAEWTASPYCDYADSKRCKPGVRVTRGGSIDVPDQSYLRAAFRDWVKETDAGYNLGIRCAY